MNEAKRRALVAITREALGMPEQPSSATAGQPSACCPTEPSSAKTAEEQTGCCAAPETALNEAATPDSGISSAKCCTP